MRLRLYAVALATAGFAGCTYNISSYQVANAVPKDLLTAKPIRVSGASAFEDTGRIICRAAGNVELPGGQTFAQYLQEAVKKEAAASGLLDERNGLELRMMLQRVDFSTALGATNWFIDALYSIDGSEFRVATVYNDRSSYLGDKACNNIAAYFQKAVAAHVRQLFNEPVLREKLKLL